MMKVKTVKINILFSDHGMHINDPLYLFDSQDLKEHQIIKKIICNDCKEINILNSIEKKYY